jgi:L-ribulokinase
MSKCIFAAKDATTREVYPWGWYKQEVPRLAIGLDFGTLSARCLAVDVDSGDAESFEHRYRHGVLEADRDPAIARQNADDYLETMGVLLKGASALGDVLSIGIDATASTPIPVSEGFSPLSRRFPKNQDAYAWLWKDHSAQQEADELTALFEKEDPQRLARVGAYNAEWFWAKVLACSRRSPEVFAVVDTWVEQCDFLTANLTGNLRRGICAAGHKALYVDGYPAPEVLAKLDKSLGTFAATFEKAWPCSESAGVLTSIWAEQTGIAAGTPVAVGGVDAHSGAVGAGITQGTVCLVLGTSACHLAVSATDHAPEANGISGVAADSVLPGMWGLEAGQAAFGDLLDWAAKLADKSHAQLIEEAARLPAGSEGVIAIDFHSGNRCPFADADLKGAILGLTIKSSGAHIYRACVEALAFGIRQILERFLLAGVRVDRLVACGGVANQNAFVLQTIADVCRKPVLVAASSETCALGASIFGSVAAGIYPNVKVAQSAMIRTPTATFKPEDEAKYDAIYKTWLSAQKHLAVETNILRTWS